MKNLENKKFEDAWKHAFADADAEPNDSVWSNLDGALSKMERGEMKRSLLFYQRLAAASIIIAFLLGGVTILNWNDSGTYLTLNEKRKEIGKAKANSSTRKSDETNDRSISSSQANVERQANQSNVIKNSGETENTIRKPNQIKVNGISKPDGTNQLIANTENEQGNSVVALNTQNENLLNEDYPLLIELKIPSYAIALTGRPVFAQTNSTTLTEFNEPILPQPKKKINDEDWWAAVGGSAGAYFPQGVTSNSLASSTYAPSAVSQSNSTSSTVGSSFSFGMTVGKKIAPRWVILAGVNYLTQAVAYTSNVAANGSEAFVADAAANQKANTVLSGTPAYNVNSVNEFVSVPVQAGYVITHRKIGLQLNAGIATDIFTKNSLIDPSGKFSTSTQTAGENSSYQQLNWTGLMGTELSYKLSSHYRISLIPGMRYSFKSILKPTTTTTIQPMVWDVGFRFRYIF